MWKMGLYAALFGLLLIVFGIEAVGAQDDIPGDCAYTDGAYYQAGLFPRYEARNRRFISVNWYTGEERELRTSLDVSVDILDWSPDCHYLITHINNDVVIWDMVAGVQADLFPNIEPKRYHSWDPSSSYLILETRQGIYLWRVAVNDPILLTLSGNPNPGYGSWYPEWEVYWDYARGQVLVATPVWRSAFVVAYDLSTGQQVGVFDNQGRNTPINFTVTEDNTHVIVFTSEAESYNFAESGITVWNRDTLQGVVVDADYDHVAIVPSQVTLSPDHRYLVAGRGRILVWDLQSVPEDVDARDPIYRYPGPSNRILSIHFVDQTTLETTDIHGNTHRWDLHTGQHVG
jgi:hypothetical protein